jgi:hypothetical protein
MLITYIITFTIFFFEQLQSMNLAILSFHFRVAEIAFYIYNPRRF